MDTDRGFSYLPDNDESELDMRFDNSSDSQFVTAHDIINGTSELELTQIFQRFGDERFAPRLAKSIIDARQGTIIGSTGELKDAIRAAFPQSAASENNKVIKRAF